MTFSDPAKIRLVVVRKGFESETKKGAHWKKFFYLVWAIIRYCNDPQTKAIMVQAMIKELGSIADEYGTAGIFNLKFHSSFGLPVLPDRKFIKLTCI